MAAQNSPFVEATYGWPYGSNGWDGDMNTNLVKFSYLHDRNIDAIVSSLPAIVNGKAYFNTSDNRLYFDANGQRYSSVTPKWFEVTLRTTGEVYQFDGTTLNLGSTETAYTDELRTDLLSTAGSSQVGLPNGATVADAIKYVVPTAMTSAAVLAALQYAYANGLSVEIPDGTYTGSDIVYDKPVSMVMRQGAFFDFAVDISGREAMKSDSVTLVGDFPVFPVATTTFAGNFSAYAPGNIVMIELSAGGSQTYNEAGFDFAVVQTADASQLTLTTGTRLAYRAPKISKLSNTSRHTGTIARDAIVITGDYTAQFAVGDVIRVENVDGTGGAEGSAFYFEFNKVSAIDATQITLETRTIQQYINPWLIKTDMIKGIKISGGRIKRLTIRHADSVFIYALDVDRAIYGSWYRYQVIGGHRRGLQEPSTSNATWLFNGSMSDISCGGSSGSTDNGAFKILSCPNMQLLNISGGNTKATAQGNYGVFLDFFFTPYRVWNENLQAQNIRGETPNGGSDRSVWVTGVRNGNLQITGGHVFLQSMVDCLVFVGCASKQLEVADIVRSNVKGDCKFVTWNGCFDSTLDVAVRDTLGVNSNRCCWVRGGTKNPETGAPYTQGDNNEFNVVNYSANPSDTTIYLQIQDNPVIGDRCRDRLGLANSISLGSNVNTPRMSPNFLQNSIPTLSAWSSKRVKGYLNMDGAFQDGGIKVNGQHLWVSNGVWRTLDVKPTSSGLGSVLTTKVAVPASATAAGKPGDWAASSTFRYDYTGDGTTHSWVRVAVATW